ncbi:MAG: sulfite exporter TauE/SafE family protein [Chloroflexi bacterium]|nr:sulfite exporter TauE/SafE family protein [Chloroflexota bacterium]
MDVSSLIVFTVVLLATFTQSLTGFGSGLVTMAFLPAVIGIRSASPLVALFAGTLEAILFWRFRGSINLRALWRLMIGAVIGIPLGILGARFINERVVLAILGSVLVAYPLYAFFTPKLPRLPEGKLTFGFGVIAGMLGGAYNTSGPAVIIYGDSRAWSPAEFKANLQMFFLLNDAVTIASHALSGNMTPFVLQNYLQILPAIAVGMLAGFHAERWINPVRFRQLVLALLILLGVRMMLMAYLGV